jgi:hypothetical protein
MAPNKAGDSDYSRWRIAGFLSIAGFFFVASCWIFFCCQLLDFFLLPAEK